MGRVEEFEIAHRVDAGVDVTLYWLRRNGRIVLSVTDLRTEQCFRAPVAREKAMDAFRHPFAYLPARAARRVA